MQDGVPPHFALPVCAWLDNSFSSGWIGRRGTTEWSPRSSCITPFDLFLWGWANEETKSTWWIGTTNSRFFFFSFWV